MNNIHDIPIHWVHFGNGELFDELKCYTESMQTQEKVELRGAISNQDVLSYYKECGAHLFLNVSESEGIPVSIMEAMSFGIPIVATDVGGVAEME